MNIKTALKSAAVSLALSLASIPAFCAEPVTSYVPSDAAAAVYLDLAGLYGAPAIQSLLQSMGLNLTELLSSVELKDDALQTQMALFLIPNGDKPRIGAIVNTAEADAILSAGGLPLTEIEFDGAKMFQADLGEEGAAYAAVVSGDQLQILFSPDAALKPTVFGQVEAPSSLVRSLKADDSLFALAYDNAALHQLLTDSLEKQADGNDGVAGLVAKLKDPNEAAEDLKTLIFRLASGKDSSLNLFLTARFKTAEARGEFVEMIDGLIKMLAPADDDGEDETSKEMQSIVKSLKVETKGNDAVISLNISEEALQAVVATAAAQAGELVSGALGGEEDGEVAPGGDDLEEEDVPPDFEAMVPLEETPDPDEEGIDEDERAKRLQMREEAMQRREEKIAELRAEYEQGAAARAEARRIAALNKKMFGFLKEKDWERAFETIMEGADVNGKDENGRTPAFYCIENGNLTILNNLDKYGKNKVDPNAIDNSGMSLLHCAVLKKQEGIITYLLKVRACSPRTQITKTGASPLYDAARMGTYEMVKDLVTFGADPNVATTTGLTPLHQAAARGNLDMVKELVQAGAEVNAIAGNGRTPIFYAASRGKASTVSFLLEKKALLNLSDKDGFTPLHCAASSGNFALVKFLVNKKANFAATAKDGTTTLISGAKYPEIVKFLADKLPNVNGVDKDGNSVLHLCAGTADVETIQKLLLKDANESLANKKGETPILFAARAGNVEMVRRLLALKVEVTQQMVDEAKTQEIKDMLSKELKKK